MFNNKIALIPAYEPTFTMINLLKELKKESFTIVVVNDGSGIEYNDIFKEVKKYSIVLDHEINKGKGVALKTGLKYIKDNFRGDYVVVSMDCDGQHTVRDAQKLWKYAINNTDTIVLGKRIRGSQTPLRSKLGNCITRFVYRVTTGLDVYDTQTGLRAFSNNLIDFLLQIKGDRFEYEMNVLLKCSINKIKIKELEIKTIYIDNNSHSHFQTVRDSILVYKEIFIFSMSSFVSFLVDYLLYSLFIIISNNLVISNILARIISSVVNYNINRKMVFKIKKDKYKSAIKYFLLVVIILFLNTNVLNLLVETFYMNKFIAKIITELILFVLNWFIQKKFVFSEYKGEL